MFFKNTLTNIFQRSLGVNVAVNHRKSSTIALSEGEVNVAGPANMYCTWRRLQKNLGCRLSCENVHFGRPHGPHVFPMHKPKSPSVDEEHINLSSFFRFWLRTTQCRTLLARCFKSEVFQSSFVGRSVRCSHIRGTSHKKRRFPISQTLNVWICVVYLPCMKTLFQLPGRNLT